MDVKKIEMENFKVLRRLMWTETSFSKNVLKHHI